VVLSIGKLAAGPGAGRYYVDQVACGAEDYYAGEGEAPGQWTGHGAEALGLTGHVQEVQIVRLLEGRDPATGELLRQPVSSKAVAGFDLTFRAPKSVSVLFGIADGAVVSELRAAHGAAAEQALRYLERDACRVRRGAGGEVSCRGEGFVAAAFEHRSSRAGDPLLHTHVVVANTARGPDGRWSALDGRLLYRHAKAAGYLNQAALRAEITERLGLEWGQVVNGVADLKVVPRGVIEHFSQRRGEILEHMAQRGERSSRAAQIATLETRRAKRNVSIGRLRQEWRSRAAEHGLTQRHVEWALRRARPRQPRGLNYERIAAALEGPDGLTRERSSFTRRDLLQALAEAAADGAKVANVEALADSSLRRQSVVALAPVAGERRFSTCELVAVERRTLATAARRIGAGVAIADSSALRRAIEARPSLSGEQRKLVARLTQSGRGVEVVRAPAGAGKTFALDAAREAWHRSAVSPYSAVRSRLARRANCATRRLSRRRRSPTSLAPWISASDSRPGLCCSSTRLRWSAPARLPACPTPWGRQTASSCWSAMTGSCQRSKRVACSERSRTSLGR
jgi:conjugative relaxase-like TrwC/TraI family protein